jgi:hypothetical protein
MPTVQRSALFERYGVADSCSGQGEEMVLTHLQLAASWLCEVDKCSQVMMKGGVWPGR